MPDNSDGNFRSYTNGIVVNNLVLVPVYSNHDDDEAATMSRRPRPLGPDGVLERAAVTLVGVLVVRVGQVLVQLVELPFEQLGVLVGQPLDRSLSEDGAEHILDLFVQHAGPMLRTETAREMIERVSVADPK